jgi:hypothetical protein
MDRREIRDILTAHADQLIDPGVPGVQDRTRYDQVRGLLELAEHLQGILVPVESDSNFRRRLHGDLILEAQRRQAEPDKGLLEQHRKGIVIGAVIGSIASVAGVILAFLLRYPHGRATHTAAG